MSNELEQLRQENEELRARLNADRYRKLEKLGEGGYCTAWRAVLSVSDDVEIEVCLKELHPHLRNDPACLRYLHSEARIGANLRNHHIVPLIDVDFERCRLVYALVDGVDLQRLIEHMGDKPLAVECAIFIGLEMASGLDYAHRRTRKDAPAGVVHRDLKPANVMISVDGHVQLADFGVAAISTERQNSVRGTVEWMSPEQACAEGRVDVRSDLFSLGVVLYELIAGKRPFDADGDGPASFQRLLTGVYPPLESVAPGTPRELTGIIDRLLQLKPENRYQSAREVITALSAFALSRETIRRTLGTAAHAARKRKTKAHFTPMDGMTPASLRRSSPSNGPTERLRSAPARARMKPRTLAASLGFTTAVAVAVWLWPMAGYRTLRSPEVVHAEAAAKPPKLAVSSAVPSAPEAAIVTDVSPAVAAQETLPTALVVAPGVGGNSQGETRSDALPSGASLPPPAPPQRDSYVSVSADKSAPVRVDGRLVGYSPVAAKVKPGSHKVVVGEGEHQQTISTRVAAGATKELSFKLRHPEN